MQDADIALVYFSPEVISHKKLEPISPELVKENFGTNNVIVFTNTKDFIEKLENTTWENTNLLLMSSGNFDGINLNEFAKKLLS